MKTFYPLYKSGIHGKPWRHIRSNDYRNVLAVMEIASGPPEIKFVEALETDGMELIGEIRG